MADTTSLSNQGDEFGSDNWWYVYNELHKKKVVVIGEEHNTTVYLISPPPPPPKKIYTDIYSAVGKILRWRGTFLVVLATTAAVYMCNLWPYPINVWLYVCMR